ncbi:hypothetical protein Saga11_08840 [Bacillus safensis]|nr:hypothetical protein Saga11_08840 [Bacillus safensis]
MYGEIEDFALEVAKYYRRAGRFKMASDYYHIVSLVRTEIKKGEIICENKSDYLGIDDNRGRSFTLCPFKLIAVILVSFFATSIMSVGVALLLFLVHFLISS